MSPTSSLKLRMDGHDVVGEVGHAAKRYRPARPEPIPASLQGKWMNDDFGARLEVCDGGVIMGAGPTRRSMPLQSLGGGRFLFTLNDGPWKRRICLNLLASDRMELPSPAHVSWNTAGADGASIRAAEASGAWLNESKLLEVEPRPKHASDCYD